MLNPRSFEEILETFSEGNSPETCSTSFSAGWESHQDAFGLAQLLTELPVMRTSLNSRYPKQARPARPLHILSEDQTRALINLQTHAPELQGNFSPRELKSAYRKSVLKTHPDRGGAGETFQEVRKSYQILLAVVTK